MSRARFARVPRVLVLDDDVAIAELLRVVLEDAGHQTIVSSDAGELPGVSIDCVVTDLMSVTVYSRADAREWILRLRDRYPSTPIIVVTAHLGAFHDRDELGVQRVIMKPFEVDQLQAAVAAVTAR